MTRFLGIDYGTRRIGLAVSDGGGMLASPLTTIDIRGGMAEQVRAVLVAAEPYDVDALVVGLPMNMDDSEGPQARLARAFGDALARASGLPLYYADERLSTRVAEEMMLPADWTRKQKKARRDRIAAQVILQSFLDDRGRDGP